MKTRVELKAVHGERMRARRHMQRLRRGTIIEALPPGRNDPRWPHSHERECARRRGELPRIDLRVRLQMDVY